MKTKLSILILFLLTVCFNIVAQEILDPYSKEYEELKLQGLIQQPEQVEVQTKYPPVPAPTDNSMLIPLDDTFIIALTANDDGYTNEIALPFNFQFYGNSLNSFFINNNGNVSFYNPYYTYTPSGFPINNFPMLAPFWADVDTRGAGSGLVHYRIEPYRVTVIWDHVGYYGYHYDKLCTFELIFTDGTDPLIGIGNNVAFCYEDMQWTTGDASGGSGGFGGSPATVGANKGDGTNYFLIGRFDHEGTDYDGPGGNSDGVSYLDDNCFSFNTGGSSNNIPPVPQGFPITQSVEVPLNNAFNLTVSFLSPEVGQTTNTVVNVPPGLNGFNYVVTAGNVCYIDMDMAASADNLGLHDIEFIATDDGNPPESTTTYLSLLVTGFMELQVEPDSLLASLCQNETTTQTITLTNTGDGDINFTLNSTCSWLSESPASGIILPGENANILVTFNSAGQTTGYHNCNLEISTNIPATPVINIPVVLEVLTPLSTYSTINTGDNENNLLTGAPDNDLNTYLCKGNDILPIEFNFFISNHAVESAELEIETFDVDTAGGFGLPFNEVDKVYFNKTYIGDLTGEHNGTCFTTIPVPQNLINTGFNSKNLVQIYVSVLGKYWCTNVQSAELRIYNCNNK